MKPQKDRRKIYLIAGIVFSIIIILVAVTVATQRSSFFGRASAPGGEGMSVTISRENSYVFASPIAAFADGESVIRITVFLLNNQGLGVGGQTITLSIIPETTIDQVQPVTDSLGRATFDLTSSNPGDYTVSAQAAGESLPQTVSISFR